MDKFPKFFDSIFLGALAILVLTLMTSMSSSATIDKTFLTCTALFVGLAFGVGGFFNGRSFCISPKLKWPSCYVCLFFAATLISQAMNGLRGWPMLSVVFFILASVFLSAHIRDTRETRKQRQR